MAFPSPPGRGSAVAPAPSGERRPSAAGFWIGGIVLVVGLVGAGVWFSYASYNLFAAVDDFPRVTVPGTTTVPLDAGRYTLYAEYAGAQDDSLGEGVDPNAIQIADAAGTSVPVDPYVSSDSYLWGEHEGRAIGEFSAPTDATYTVIVGSGGGTSAGPVRLAIGTPFTDRIWPLFAAAALGGVALLVGIVLIVVTAVRRSRWRKRMNPPLPPGYPPGAWGHPVGSSPGTWAAPPGTWGAPPGAWGPPGSTPGPPPPGVWNPPPAPPPGSPPPGGPPPPVPPIVTPSPPPVVPPGWGAPPEQGSTDPR